MSIARDRANRSGTDPLQIDNTKLITDSGDLKVQDTSGNEKKLIADEIHVGTGSDKVILKRDSSTGKVAIQTQASGEAAQGGTVASTTIYATTALLPTSPSDGEQALVTANNFLYIAKSSGWYKIAEITNTTPSITSAGNATYQLLTDGTPVSIEITATDAEVGTALQYKYVVSSGSIGSTATVTSSATSGGTYSALAANTLTTNKFFKVTPSTNSAHAGTFSLTFSASDGVAVATSSASSFTLQFDVSGSYKFDGSGDYVTTTDNASYAFGTGAFSVECFYNVNFDTSGSGTIFLYDFGSEDVRVTFKSGAIRAQLGSETQLSYSIDGNTLDKNTFHHHALIRDGSGKVQLLHNGSVVGSYTGSTYNVASTTLRIGDKHSGSKEFTGYISNFRIVKGSAAYTPTTVSGGSTSFDGSGDYLATQSSSNLQLGSGNYTIEYWMKATNFDSTGNIFDNRDAGVNNSIITNTNTSGQHRLWYVGGYRITSSALSTNTWYHIAIVRNSGVTTMYINGVAQSTTWSDTTNFTGQKITLGTEVDGASSEFHGYISNFRVVVGTAVYTSNFTPPNTALTAISNTQLLTCQNSTGAITDASSNNLTITANGNAAASTSKPFTDYITVPTSDLSAITNTKLLAFTEKQPDYITTGSTLFDGTNDSLSIPNFAMGTSNYTIEMWFYPTSLGNYVHLYDGRGGHSSSQHATLIQLTNTGTLRFYSTSFRISGSDTVSANTWNHVALERVGNINTLYLNGVSQGTYDDGGTTFVGPANNVGRIGSDDNGAGSFFPGYISDFRIVIGSAVYNGAFTPPTSTLTAITNTQILTSRTSSGTITDASSNNHTITANNGAAASAFGVVKPPTDTSTASNTLTAVGSTEFSYASPFEQGAGGSTLFYGSTNSSNDYLVIPSSSEFALGTNDFTIEFFLRAGTNSTNYTIIFSLSGSTGAKRFEVAFHNSTIQVYTDTGGWRNTGYAPTSGAWEHFAFQRDYSGNTLKMYADGVQQWSVSNNRDYDENQVIQIGSYGSGSYGYLDGYLSNFRIVNGTAVYTHSSNSGSINLTPSSANVSFATDADYSIGSSEDFTIEAWVYTPSTFALNGGKWRTVYFCGTNGALQIAYDTSGKPVFYSGGNIILANTASTASTWEHIAFTRSGSAMVFYRNGVQDGTATNSAAHGANDYAHYIGAYSGTEGSLGGYISNFRFVVGTGVYTGAFTPPRALTTSGGTYSSTTNVNTSFTASHTMLLTGQNSSSVTDASAKNKTLTLSGNAAVATNNPFIDVPTSKLTAVTNTKLLTCNDSNKINDESTSNHSITINGDPIATRFNPF